jgi:hypothetical protein
MSSNLQKRVMYTQWDALDFSYVYLWMKEFYSFSPQFLFRRIPYDHRENNTFGHIFQDICNGVPPATKSDKISSEEAQIWAVLEGCWGTTPSTRASAQWVLEALRTTGRPVQYNIEFPVSLPYDSWPRELLHWGISWYALYNPQVPKALMVYPVHEIDHVNAVTCIRYSLINSWMEFSNLTSTDSAEIQNISLPGAEKWRKFSTFRRAE